MKYLILLFMLTSCSSYKYIKPFPKLSEFKSFEVHSYGDERFDDCKEIYYIHYGITYSNDTLMLKKEYKYKCDSYNYTTWTD